MKPAQSRSRSAHSRSRETRRRLTLGFTVVLVSGALLFEWEEDSVVEAAISS